MVMAPTKTKGAVKAQGSEEEKTLEVTIMMTMTNNSRAIAVLWSCVCSCAHVLMCS